MTSVKIFNHSFKSSEQTENVSNGVFTDSYSRPYLNSNTKPLEKKTISLIVPTNVLFETTSINNNALTSDNQLKTNDNEKLNEHGNKIEISKGIFMKFVEKNVFNSQNISKTITAVLYSKTNNARELLQFYEELKCKYDKVNSNKNGKMFIYEKHENNKMIYSCYNIDRSQKFENLFLHNKEKILTTIKKLEDVDYYKKFGLKRKLGHLYVGLPGTGKTCVTTAMANMTGRTPVYIPISRIYENSELQKIFYDRCFNGIKYELDELIFVIDELDSVTSQQNLQKNVNTEKNTQKLVPISMPNIIINTHDKQDDNSKPSVKLSNKKNDEFNVGMFLSMLDGNIDQDGMMIIAAANSCKNFDPALYRTGRLELFEFEYMDRNDIRDMINFYYETTISDEQYNQIRNDKKIESLVIKNLCLDHLTNNQSIDEMISNINSLVKKSLNEHTDSVQTQKELDEHSDMVSGKDSNEYSDMVSNKDSNECSMMSNKDNYDYECSYVISNVKLF